MPREIRIPDRSEVTDDTALLLNVAARLAFPDGTVSGLAPRNAASRGELEYERIGGCLYNTLAAITWVQSLVGNGADVRQRNAVGLSRPAQARWLAWRAPSAAAARAFGRLDLRTA